MNARRRENAKSRVTTIWRISKNRWQAILAFNYPVQFILLAIYFSMPYDEFEAKALEFDVAEYIPEPKKPRTAFKDAFRYTKKPKELRVQELRKASSEYIVIGMYKQIVDGYDNEAEINVNHEINVLFHKRKKELTLICRTNDSALKEVAEAYFRELLATYKLYLSASVRDLNDTLKNFCVTHGIRTQKKGGSYFIPAKFEKDCANLSNFVKQISENSDFLSVPFYCHPNYDGKQDSGIISVQRMAKKALLSEVVNLDRQIYSYTLTKELYDIICQALDEAVEILPDRDTCIEYLETIKPTLSPMMQEEVDELINSSLPNSELAAEIEVFKASIPFKESETKEKSYIARLDELNLVAEKALNFQQYLEGSGKRINQAIASLNDEIARHITSA